MLAILAPTVVARAGTTVLLTADNEGHTGPCETCPLHVGLGGLARRATLVGSEHTPGAPSPLLLDAGNFLVGTQNADSQGRVIVAAYNALAYDAVNLSYRDLRSAKTKP